MNELPQFNGHDITKIFAYLSKPTYENFIFFVKTFLKPYMSSEFIEEDYYKTIHDDMWANRHALFQLPRGHSKTEMVGIWETIYIVATQPQNPFHPKQKEIVEQMILAGDSTSKHAWAERIKHFFYNSPYLQWLLPYGVKNKENTQQNDYWNDRVLYFSNGHKVLLRAIGERAIRGNHVDRLHADDLVTENSMLVDQDIKDKWDGAVDGITTNKRAMVQVTGTPLRYSDILFHLKERKYFFVRMPAIKSHDTKEILSPKRWSYDDLMKTKERIGSVRFQCEYMLDPIDDSTSLIKAEWVKQCFSRETDLIRTRPEWATAVYLGVDFAFSDRVMADRSAFVIIGQREQNDEMTKQKRKTYQILDIITKKGMSGPEQFEFIKQLHESYQFTMIGVEENSIKAISKHLAAYNLPLKRFWTGNRDSKEEKMILKPYETIGKRNLILRLGNMFELRQLIVPYASDEARLKAEELLNECISFAQEEEKLIEIGVHPDIPIGLGYAIEAAGRPSIVFGHMSIVTPKKTSQNFPTQNMPK